MNLQAQRTGDLRVVSVIGVVLIATLAVIYMISQTLRNSIGVIAPDLAAELGLSAAQLGTLSSAFFISFALAQIPLGVALDRFGPKLCMLVCTAIVVVGAAWFAMAATPTGLILARALIGLGSSCYLMAPLAFYARRFAPERFATLAGLQLGLGTIGTVVATAPLAFSAATLGWRGTFFVIAGAMVAAGILVALVLPSDRPVLAAAPRETLRESLAGTLAAARTPSVAPLFLMQLAAYSSFVLIVGLWGGPYLTHVYGYGLTDRGDLLFLAAVGQNIALILNGPIERLIGSYKRFVLLGSGSTMIMLLVLAAVGTLPMGGLPLWLFAFGLLSGYTPVLIAHGQTLFPPALIGRGLTLLNIGTMAGVFLSQLLTGMIVNLFPDGAYPSLAYRVVFALQAGFLLLAILPYLRVQDAVNIK